MTRILAILLLIGFAGAAHAQPSNSPWPSQCPVGTASTAIGCQPQAATPSGTDLVMGWQVNQSPKTRAMQVQQLTAASTPSLNLRLNCGAVGDGVTDDSLALKTCLNDVQTSLAAGVPMTLRIPAGIYLIKATNGTMPTITGWGAYIQGEGQHKTFIVLDTGYVGDLFSVSNASSTLDFPGNTVDPKTDANGYAVRDLTIIGNVTSAAQQNAIRLYDLDDDVLIQNVSVFSLNGQCMSMGRAKNSTNAYTRESSIWNLKCWNTGTASQPAVEFTSTAGGDGTNEIKVYDLNVFHAAGVGVQVSNPSAAPTTRAIEFHGLRIEDSVSDGLQIGLSTDLGNVHGIDIFGLDEPTVNSGTFGVKISHGGAAPPYGIAIFGGTIGPGAGKGIDIDWGSLITLAKFDGFSVSSTDITIGQHATDNLYFDGQAMESWTYSVDPSYAYHLYPHYPAQVYGLPGAVNLSGSAILKGSGSSTAAIRVTMDGAAANPQNCFAPRPGQALGFSAIMLAEDATDPTKNYTWSMPVAYFSAISGAASATLTPGTAATVSNGTLTGSSVTFNADTTNGCPNLSWTPPTANTDTWNVTATYHFVRAP